MKQYILLLVLMVMGAGMTVHAEDVNPVKVGNVISGHIIEKGMGHRTKRILRVGRKVHQTY